MKKHAEYPDWMGKWLNSLVRGMGAMDEATWSPFDIFRFNPYYSDLAVTRMGEAASKLEEKNPDLGKLAKHLNSPQVTRVEMYLAATDLKASGMNREKIGPRIFEFYNRVLHVQCKRDYYGENSSYVHSDEELRELVEKVPWEKGSFENGREIGRLINSLSELSWSLYSDYFYPRSYKNLGPYAVNLAGRKTLIVREYTDCKPIEIWGESRLNPAKHVKILTAYNPAAGIGMDWIEHIYAKKNLPRNLTHFAIWADGKWLGMDDAIELRHKFEECAAEQFERFSNLPYEEVKKKLITFRYYELKEFYTELGMEWRPTKEML
ncbi:MAG: hypothetical protein V1835_00395, partial [Candidatus Micrarchaeota archaeon]